MSIKNNIILAHMQTEIPPEKSSNFLSFFDLSANLDVYIHIFLCYHKHTHTYFFLGVFMIFIFSIIVDWQCSVNFYYTAKWPIYSFLTLFSIRFHCKWLDIVPNAIYIRTSLLIHSKCNSLHLSTLDTQSIPLPPLPLGNHKSVLHVHHFCSCGKVHLCHILDCRYVLSYGICLSLSGLLHLVWESLVLSMLLQMTLFCSFLWLSRIPLCIYTISS